MYQTFEKWRASRIEYWEDTLCGDTDITNDPWWSPAGYQGGLISQVLRTLRSPQKIKSRFTTFEALLEDMSNWYAEANFGRGLELPGHDSYGCSRRGAPQRRSREAVM